MTEELKQLHINAGLKSGIEHTCVNKQGKSKINYYTEENAIRAAEAMNKRKSPGYELEAYPCAFCNGWHIGKVMPIEFLRQFISI